ncbi:hypothetical protein D3C77_510190 [compost metagenome]
MITEYLPHQAASAENFVRRNRIQAALCDTLVPVEWQIKSGTAHTVGFACKYGKRIANLYLPMTLNSRPEIGHSSSNYQAHAFEAPAEVVELLHYVFRLDTPSDESIKV